MVTPYVNHKCLWMMSLKWLQDIAVALIVQCFSQKNDEMIEKILNTSTVKVFLLIISELDY